MHPRAAEQFASFANCGGDYLDLPGGKVWVTAAAVIAVLSSEDRAALRRHVLAGRIDEAAAMWAAAKCAYMAQGR